MGHEVSFLLPCAHDLSRSLSSSTGGDTPVAGRRDETPSIPAGPRGGTMSDRKLIRPSMTEMMDRFPTRTSGRRKQVPAEQTNAENFYYLKQMQNRTPMIVVLTDGTELTGWIEWYDKNCIKLNRNEAPNLLLYKHTIKFMFKQEELRPRRRKRAPRT
jgi:RNA chaperone Hfq